MWDDGSAVSKETNGLTTSRFFITCLLVAMRYACCVMCFLVQYSVESTLWLLMHCSTWWRHKMETFPVNSPPKWQWRGALTFSLICTWINGWVNNRDTGIFETPSRPFWRHCNDDLCSQHGDVGHIVHARWICRAIELKTETHIFLGPWTK